MIDSRRDLLLQVADSLLALPYKTWDFGDSVAFEALLAATTATADQSYQAFVHGWVRAWATRADYRRLDCTAPGAVMVALFERTGDARVLEAACRLADYLVARPRLDSGLFATWEHSPLLHPYGPDELDARGAFLIADTPAGAFVDCLHFDPPFLAALGVATGDDRYSRIGVEQALAYIGRLQQPDGTFDHFELSGEPDTFGPGWGRGQGWALLGLLEVLHSSATNETYSAACDDLRQAVRSLIVGMLSLQRTDGHWATNIRDDSTGVENSTAAFMAIGFRRAVRQGLFRENEALGRQVSSAADRAQEAVLAALTGEGTLSVSAAVMACTTDSHYSHVPTGFTVPWGQGPVAIMLAEEGTE